WVDMAAPGSSLVTTANGGGYEPASGTSMASPMVAGAAALLIAQGYEPSPDAISAQLVRTGQPINDGAGGVIRRLHIGNATEQTSPYGTGFPGGNSVAVGEVDGSSAGKEIITAAGPGGGPHVRYYTANMNPLGGGFYAFPTSFHGGVDLAVGDLLPDSAGNEIVVAAGPGGGPHVRVFTADGNPAPGAAGSGFFAYGGGFSGGVSVAVGDVRPDAPGDEIITGVFSRGGPHVRVFTPTGQLLGEWYAFDGGFQGGVTVGVGNFDAGESPDIAVAAGPGAGPHVKLFRGDGVQLGPGFYAYDSGFGGGVDIAVVTTGGIDRIVTVPRGFGGPHVRLFNASGEALSGGVFAFLPSQTTGLSVAAGDNQIVVGTRATPDLTRALPLSAVS
ncbi:MAG: S8 family serine peptidase, partial [Acidimicrobiales bacterium]|nr:S8 family serine peptidase [Acidimicrobiales bacterium]